LDIEGLTPIERAFVVMISKATGSLQKSSHWIGELTGHRGPTGIDVAQGRTVDVERAPANPALAAYLELARLAQGFFTRYPLIEGQGNFGHQDGNLPADHVYTECRASGFGRAVYDAQSDSFRLPLFLLNGTRISGQPYRLVPHHITDVAAVTLARLRRPDISCEELATLLRGPDFPCGGAVRSAGARALYVHGAGPIESFGKTQIRRGEGSPPPLPSFPLQAPTDKWVFIGPEQSELLETMLARAEATRRARDAVMITALPIGAAVNVDAWIDRVSTALGRGEISGVIDLAHDESGAFEILAELGVDIESVHAALNRSGFLKETIEVTWEARLDALLDAFIERRMTSLMKSGLASDTRHARPLIEHEIEMLAQQYGDSRRTELID
jgi:DNA gyrase/topoisomerase IV subunit A